MARCLHGQEVSQEEKELRVLRLFQRFPDVLLHLGDPQLTQSFELPWTGRSSVKMRRQLNEDVLTIELARRLPLTSLGVKQKVPDSSQCIAEALEAMTATLAFTTPPTLQRTTIAHPARDVASVAVAQSLAQGAAEAHKEAKPTQRKIPKPARHELFSEADSSSGSPVFGRSLAPKTFAKKASNFARPPLREPQKFEEKDEVWVPGQSSDEELMVRAKSVPGKSNSSTSKRDTSPSSSDPPCFESPFFPVALQLQRDATGNTEPSDETSSTSIGLDFKSLRSPQASSSRMSSDNDLFRGMANARGLGARRGLALQLSSKSSRSAMHSSAVPPSDDDGRTTPPSASSFKVGMRIKESEEPAVQLLFQTEPKRRTSRCNTIPADMMLAIGPRIMQVAKVPRPLPAAFPRRRNIIFFDWDDTLCPTSWIRSLLKEHLADMEDWLDQCDDCPVAEEDWRDSIPSWFKQPLPDEPHVRQLIADLQTACIRTIRVAQSLGVVCIVTNAVPGWVEKTIKRWLPKLRTHIGVHSVHSQHPIKVIYAQQAYCDGRQDLPFVDEQGEFMLWKKAAMAGALTELDRLYGLENEKSEPGQKNSNSARPAKLVNVVSIGDTEAEMSAAELASQGLRSRHPKRGRLYRRACGLQDMHPPDPGNPQSEKPQSRTSSKDGSKDDASGSSSESGSVHRHADSPDRPEREREREPESEFGCGRSRSLSSLGRGRPWPWVKLIKLSEGCQARRLTAQLEEIAQLLPKMLALRRNVRVDLTEGLACGKSDQLWEVALGCTEDDLQLERHLCVETV